MASKYDQNFYGLLQALLDVIAELTVMRAELDAIQDLLEGGGGGVTAWGSITGTLSAQADLNSALSGKQDADTDLTGLAALSTTGLVERTGLGAYSTATVTSYIKTLLDDSDAATARTTLGVAIGTNVQAYSVRLDEISSNFAGASNGYVIRKKLDGTGLEYAVNTASVAWGGITGTLTSQTDLQSALNGKQDVDADLTAIAGLSGVGLVERTGAGTASTNTVTSYIKTLLDDTDASTARTTLGVVIGTDVQAYSARLADIVSGFAGATNGHFIRKNAAGTALEYATPTASAAWGSITGTLSSQTDLQTALDGKQPIDSDLTAIAGLTGTGFIERTGTGTATTNTVTSFAKTILDDADAAAVRTTIGAQATVGYIYIKETYTSGTNVASGAAGVWTKRNLNSEVVDSGSHASLSSGVVTLAAGTYEFEVNSPAFYVNSHQARLTNTSDTIHYYGSSSYSQIAADGFDVVASTVKGRFTIASSKTFEVQHRVQTENASNGFGNAASFGTEENYCDVVFRKVA